jgi:hypothetical protein
VTGYAVHAQKTLGTAEPVTEFSEFLYVFLDGGEADQGCEVLDPLAKIAKRRATMHAVLVGENVPQNFLGIN